MLRRFRRPLLPLAVLLALAPAVAGAATPLPRPAGGPTVTQGWLNRGWAALASWWTALDGGCGIDPNGRCRQATPPAGTDGGCGLDPNGLCLQATPPAGTDNGCMIDPNGCAGR